MDSVPQNTESANLSDPLKHYATPELYITNKLLLFTSLGQIVFPSLNCRKYLATNQRSIFRSDTHLSRNVVNFAFCLMAAFLLPVAITDTPDVGGDSLSSTAQQILLRRIALT